MTDTVQVALEIGPKGKRVVAFAPDWPGLERGGKSEEAAVSQILAYLPRYAPVAQRAGLETTFMTLSAAEVVERYPGVSSTDFWGVSFALAKSDRQPLSTEAFDRELALLEACWSFFDDVRSRVSAEMRRGPRGGGRDRDAIVEHTFRAEQQLAKKLGVTTPRASLDDDMWQAHRTAYLAAIRSYFAEGKTARTWPLRYLIRSTAYHTLDHAWEMEDKDLRSAHDAHGDL